MGYKLELQQSLKMAINKEEISWILEDTMSSASASDDLDSIYIYYRYNNLINIISSYETLNHVL